MSETRYYCEAPDRAVIAIDGEDRVSFLQALISNDIADLPLGHARWAALLTPQGKYLCDFFVIAAAERLLIEVEASRAEDLLQRLRRYKLRAKVTLAPVPDLSVLLGWGEAAARSLDLEADGLGRSVEGFAVFVDPRLDRLGVRVIGILPGAAARLETAGFTPAPFEDWDRLRLEAGVPDGTRDLIPEQSILLEAGFDELHGVSWTKGCYIGQELTARTKYRALIKKRLIPVGIAGPPPAFGAVILQGGKEAGEMRSAQGDRGLALLRLDALGPEAGALEVAGAILTPVPPDWLNRP